MNKYLRATVVIPVGAVKMCWTKLFHFKGFHGSVICMISPSTEITMDKNARLFIGKMFKMRDGSKLRVRKKAECHIGNNTAFGSNDIVVCHERIEIGDNVELSPNVQIYDHDHDFRHPDGLASLHYKTAPVVIGDNVWIGANTVILRGTTIGDNCVISAGCVVKGNIPDGSIIVQKRNTSIIPIYVP
ncbi:MAG: acyltransferase [Lachnospiraceae bacterium]|nr:acyltransferase [Lachnospiraceae bacterium]